MAYTLIMQNNASRQEFILTGLEDVSETPLAYVFEDFEMPEGAQEGEYTCLLFRDDRDDSVYSLDDILLDSTVETEEGTVQVRRLRPEIFILKFGSTTDGDTAYRERNDNYYYYER